MLGRNWTFASAAIALCCIAASESAGQARLTIKNQCADDVWAILTPGGNPSQVAVLKNSGEWFRHYATQENFIPLGVTGSIAATSTMLTLTSKPTNPQFFKTGQIVKVVGAGEGGMDLIAAIINVQNEGLALTLKNAAQTSVVNAQVLYDTLQGAVLINSRQSLALAIPDKGAPGSNFRFFIGCPGLSNNTQPFGSKGCVMGAATGDLAGINTLFEPTFGCVGGTAKCAFNPADPAAACQQNPDAKNCSPLGPVDFFDISAVDGYTLPMTVEAKGTNCTAPSKDASMLDLGSCPGEDAGTLFSTTAKQQALIARGIDLLTRDGKGNYEACVAPYKWFELATVGSPRDSSSTLPNCADGKCTSVSYYAGAGCDPQNPRLACPGGSGPQQRVGPKQDGSFGIQNTEWVRQLYALGYTGYSWQYGDGVGQQSCDAGATITVTLCPANPKPYLKAEWVFDAATGQCHVGQATANQYDSLAACQEANMRYVCDDLTAGDPFKIPGALWRADATATLKGHGYSYDQFRKQAQLICANIPVSGVGGVSSVPICTYYYAGATKLCPADATP
jgi:hypothetical protein